MIIIWSLKVSHPLNKKAGGSHAKIPFRNKASSCFRRWELSIFCLKTPREKNMQDDPMEIFWVKMTSLENGWGYIGDGKLPS